ncbi:MAG TPA: 50S ribosomal protein L9 [Gaiellaceae bacterium]|jgi:large subunit ribosomal protein L9|nr:50S ribosomal protein L9 [Gaiellaceae bacterium]
MKVILRQDVENVGLRGEVVDVARGYARNFLLPRKLAEAATPARIAEVEKVAANRARHEAQTFEQAQEISQRVAQLELRFDVKAGETGVLFGSVTPTDIADTLWERHKVRVDRRKIELSEPIKRIGRYEIPVELFQDVTVQVRTLVIPEGGELPPEAEAPVPEEDEAAPVADAAESEDAEVDQYSDEALDDAIAAAEQPERPEGAEDEQVPEDAFDRAVDAEPVGEESQER